MGTTETLTLMNIIPAMRRPDLQIIEVLINKVVVEVIFVAGVHPQAFTHTDI